MLANIIRNAKKTVGGGGGGIVIDNGDPFYSAVSLLLSMDGTNGSTTFTDSSLNGLTVTSSGVTISDTGARSGFGQFADFPGSSSSALTIPASSVFNFGTGDFTIEFWFNIPVGASGSPYGKTFVSNENNVWSAGAFSLYALASSTQFRPSFWINEFSSSVPILLPSSGDYRDGNWHHLAVVRSGSAFSMYIDGVRVANGTHAGNCGSSTRNLMIGDNLANNGGDRNFLGKLDDLRISLFARYTSTFTPPTAALPTTASSTPADPYYGYTSLLLHMDGTNASTNFVDSGPSALTVTRTGTPAISTSQSKYGGASVAFSGTTDRLGVASNALFAFGTGDFTVEFWVYFNSISTSFVQLYDTYVSGGFSFYWSGSTSTLIISNRSANQLSQAWSPSANTWYHLAVSRSGTSLKLFVNGTVLGSATASTSYAQAAIQIGGTADNASYTLNGNIDDLRITKYARYTSAFTPPTQAHPNTYNPYTTLPVSGAALWLAGDDSSTLYTDAGTSAVTKSGDLVYQWTDKSGNSRNAIQTTSGNRPTWVAPANARNNLGALGFNASQWIDLASNTAIAFGTGDFTVEAWIKPAGFGGANTAVISCGNNGFLLYITPAGILRVGQYGVADFGTSPAIPTTSWTHVAISRSGTSLKVFFNGVLNQTFTDTFNYSGSQTARIGWDATIGNGFSKYNGQIQNLVVYKGQALYTANFTPWMS